MRKLLIVSVIATCLVGAAGCSSSINIMKETPATKSLSDYSKIWVGWLDMRPADYEKYGYDSADVWKQEIHKFNSAGIQAYIKENLGDRVIGGAKDETDQPPAEADLIIKLPFDKFELKHDGWGGLDEMHLSVEFVDAASKETIYKATMFVTEAAPFPRNWKGGTFDGRVDNQTWNLASFISEKLK